MKPLILEGKDALSTFRINALLRELNRLRDSDVFKAISAHYVYLLDLDQPPDADLMKKALPLLGARGVWNNSEGMTVIPRKGTLSPWASKATDIFHNCGLTEVKRIERGIHYVISMHDGSNADIATLGNAAAALFDRMTEGLYSDLSDVFEHPAPPPCRHVPLMEQGAQAMHTANREMGLALSDEEIDYLVAAYTKMQRDPTDVELVMFGQVNSEHCRHKIFNADWIIDGVKQPETLFNMIRHTHKTNPAGTLVAYKDNSGVIEGFNCDAFSVSPDGSRRYHFNPDQLDILMKVETHNHPTAISPFAGAATGVGGEIRDEAATGIGGHSKAGLCGFMVSNLRIPGFVMPWEDTTTPFPERLATPLEIMTDGPIGGAAFGNEFGRPQLCGFFRTYEQAVNGRLRGYHKPIMLAGGMGNIRRQHTAKHDLTKEAIVMQLGGPALRIGLGGGAASSMASGDNTADLDFNSVQRDNAEMQRRCQEVIDACIALEDKNPIISIHDIGAGGLSNGCPELVADTGAQFFLRRIHSEDRSMSPMEIWCCEAQERYVLAVAPENRDRFIELCRRERCPVAEIGIVTGDDRLVLEDELFNDKPIDMDISTLLGKPPKMIRDVTRAENNNPPVATDGISIEEAASRILRLPAVANKTFLITITDRSVSGLVARDQMTGPRQTPVADVAVTASGFRTSSGEAMAVGERTPLAVTNAPASGRMAFGEAITNIMAAAIGEIGNIKFSANWMCACGEEGEDAALYDTVNAVAIELCPQLGISIPVGKDSLSMRTVWNEDSTQYRQTAPLSLIASAFAPVTNVALTLTPDLKPGNSVLIAVDLGNGRNRLGCSALAQVTGQSGGNVPDLDDPQTLSAAFDAVQNMLHDELLLAYHDRSDGGLFVTCCEMAFAGRRGFSLELDSMGEDPMAVLFNEELGFVLQVAQENCARVQAILKDHNLAQVTHILGKLNDDNNLVFSHSGDVVLEREIAVAQQEWSELTYQMQARRDNPECAREEFENIEDDACRLVYKLKWKPENTPRINGNTRPKMAILREQGINGQVEMAAAFDRAGFECIDIHMTDLLSGRFNLDEFKGLVACGGFSYGDVLGAGSGWARSVLFNPVLRDMFSEFFARNETFSLGVCNGCQMLSQLKEIIPGAKHWPVFSRNRSEQFEARLSLVEVLPSKSVLFNEMAGAILPIPVAHGEGRADFSATGDSAACNNNGMETLRYVTADGIPATRYPSNPNGSPEGLTGFTSADGRATIMMPHPERAFRSIQMSWAPKGYFKCDAGPWLKLFQNARSFVD